MQDAIDYLQAPYAQIEIKSSSAATEYLYPAAGEYNQNYKAGDSFEIKFTPAEHYQFVKWSATPMDSVSFEKIDDDSETIKTHVVINSVDSPIKIEPLAYEVPTISVSPNNNVENPRNTSIVINFSQSMNITDEILKNISITVDGIDALENFEAPVVNQEKTSITFTQKRDKMIQVGSVVRVVQVTVPKTLSYTKDDVDIFMDKIFTYSFVINATTESKAEVEVSCPVLEGEVSFSGNKVLYLDDELTVTANSKDDYAFLKWEIKYEDDNTVVGNDVLCVDENLENQTLSVKLLTGSSQKILISPVFAKRAFVMLNFYSDFGTVIPYTGNKYYVNDEIKLSYRSDGAHLFTKWIAVDENNNPVDYIQFAKEDESETTCTVLAGGNSVRIIAESAELPIVTGFSPEYSSAVTFDTPIKILFSQSMSLSNIYWTKEELEALGVIDDRYYYNRYYYPEYEIFESTVAKTESGAPYYYAYQRRNQPQSLVYKNIEITDHGEKTADGAKKNLLTYYMEPFFETSENTTLVIYGKHKMFDSGVDRKTIIDVKLNNTNFVSQNGIPLKQQLVKTYITDNKPTYNNIKETPWLDSLELSGTDGDGTVTFSYNGRIDSEFKTKDGEIKTVSWYDAYTPRGFSDRQILAETYKDFPFIDENGKLKFVIGGYVTTNTTAPVIIRCSLYRLRDSFVGSSYLVDNYDKPLFIELNPGGDFSEKGLEFNLDMSNRSAGVYEYIFSAIDGNGKESFFERAFYICYNVEK